MYRNNGFVLGKRGRRMLDTRGYEKKYTPGRSRKRTLNKRAAKNGK